MPKIAFRGAGVGPYLYIMDSIRIAKASPADIVILQEIGRQTFFETFAESNTEENMQRYLDESFTYDKVKGELENPDSLFYIAWEDDEAIGYLKVNMGKAQTEAQEDAGMEIERIYVRRDYHGKKVGQLLYEKAMEIAHSEHKAYLWLGVWEENPRAIRFYEKNGFAAFSKHIFKVGEDEQTDIMMRKAL